jgi:hypothetical protein
MHVKHACKNMHVRFYGTGEPTVSWLYGSLEFFNLSILLRVASTFNQTKEFIHSKNKNSFSFALFLPVRLLAIASS